MARKNKEMSFEESVAELELIVAELENGKPDLKELMEKYKHGIELANKCLQELDAAEQTMDLIIREQAGEVREEALQIE